MRVSAAVSRHHTKARRYDRYKLSYSSEFSTVLCRIFLDKFFWAAYSSINCFSRLKLSQQGATMKNVYEVLRQKELELARLEKEVEALRVAAPLLSDDKDVGAETTTAKPTLAPASSAPQQPIRIPQPQVAATQPTARAAGWEDNAKRWP
jgi:hypothetical protein